MKNYLNIFKLMVTQNQLTLLFYYEATDNLYLS